MGAEEKKKKKKKKRKKKKEENGLTLAVAEQERGTATGIVSADLYGGVQRGLQRLVQGGSLIVKHGG